MGGSEATKRRRWPITIAAVAVLALVGIGAAALAAGDDDDPNDGDDPRPQSSEDIIALPTGRISTADACTGFACTFKVTSPTPLPDDAQWRWTVNGVQQPKPGPTLTHTFDKDGRATIMVVSSQGGKTGAPARAVIRLGSWAPTVKVASTNDTSTRGTMSITLTSPKHPECLPRPAQLVVKSGDGFKNQGKPLKISRHGTAEVDVDRGQTYQIVLAQQDVPNGICQRATSQQVYVAQLPVVTTTPDTIPDTIPDTVPDNDNDNDDGNGNGNGNDNGPGPRPDPGPGPSPNPGREAPSRHNPTIGELR